MANQEELRQELARLRIAADNIERLLTTQATDRQNNNRRGEDYPYTHPVVRDAMGTEILVGDRVSFLTRGTTNSNQGRVYKISSNGRRVTARDEQERPISRAPNIIQVIFS